MGTYKAGQQNQRVLTQNRTGSYSVTLPISLVRKLKWRSGQRVVVRQSGQKLVIEDYKE